MLRISFLCLALAMPAAGDDEPEETARTWSLEPAELKEFPELSAARRALIEAALEVAEQARGRPYCFGGSDPETGFDCSGAIYHVLRQVGIQPPRSSDAQFRWLKAAGEFHEIPAAAQDLDHESLDDLEPGDLLFWSGTYGESGGITHVAIYLGPEKRDGRPVMINATNGRSYRGEKGNGFGVFDFRLPRPGAKGRLVGYGTPPGLEEKPDG